MRESSPSTTPTSCIPGALIWISEIGSEGKGHDHVFIFYFVVLFIKSEDLVVFLFEFLDVKFCTLLS
jgi:hypothetical protein